jgi:predicted RNA polymerase sigma factor
VTRRDQSRNEVPSQCPGRSRDEDSHDLSFRVVPSLEDKAPPEAVTFFNAVAVSMVRGPEAALALSGNAVEQEFLAERVRGLAADR